MKVLHLDKQTHVIDKIIELAPQAVDKVKEMMDKRKEDDPEFHHRIKKLINRLASLIFVNKAILFALSIGTNYHLHCTYFV